MKAVAWSFVGSILVLVYLLVNILSVFGVCTC